MGTYPFKLPDIGEGVVEAEITVWHVALGDVVEEDQPIADAMTDKATIELTAPVAGRVSLIACDEGEMLAVGATLVEFETEGEAEFEGSPVPEPPAETNSGSYHFKLPDIGEGVVEAEITKWHVAVGDRVEEDQPIADAMTDKATIELTSPVAGVVRSVACAEGEMLAVGATLVEFGVEGSGNASDQAARQSPAIAPGLSSQNENSGGTPKSAHKVGGSGSGPETGEGFRPLASPAVRKRALDAGLDLSAAIPTGAEGNITHADLDLLESTLQPADGETRIKVIGLRRKIAQSMAESKRTIAHFTYVDEVDVTELEALRKRANARSGEDKPKLTVLPFIIRALAATLQDWPQFNALYQDERGYVSQFSDLNLGIATQTDIGLVVPVIQRAQTLSVWDMAREIARLANGARDNQLSPSDFQGATTTLTSLGPLGGIVTTPVVNKPQVAIFGPNKIRPKLEMRDGEVVERLVMNFSVSCDHRVIDGYDAAMMVQELKARLEDPVSIFL